MLVKSRFTYEFMCLLLAVAISGCGSPAADEVVEDDPGDGGDKTSQKSDDADEQDAPKPAVLAMVDRLPHKKIWFDDPISIVSDSQDIEKPKPAAPTNTGGPTEPVAPPPASGGNVDWNALVTADLLDAEVQSVRAYFTENLASMQTYNTSYLEVAPNVAAMIAVADVASRAKNSPAWKDQANTIRALAESMLADELRRGAKSYNQVKEPFDKIVSILDGKPADGIEPGEAVLYEDLAVYTSDFMKRLEKSEQRMKILAGGEANFAKNKDAIKREAAVIGILCKMITLEGFGYSDDEEFLGFANPASASAVKMIKAADSGDYSTFEVEMSNVSKNCTTCHMGYR